MTKLKEVTQELYVVITTGDHYRGSGGIVFGYISYNLEGTKGDRYGNAVTAPVAAQEIIRE